MATASNCSLVFAASASSKRRAGVLVAAALADNDSPDTAPRTRRWSHDAACGRLRAPICLCSREGAMLLSSRRRHLSGVAGTGISVGTTTRGPLPGLGVLGCGRCPLPVVPGRMWRFMMLISRLPGGVGLPCARSAPSRPALFAVDAPYGHLHIYPRALPGRHSLNACTSHVPTKIKLRRALSASARAAPAGGPLTRSNCSVPCCGGRRCCRRVCCCCCSCCRVFAAAPRSRGWTTVQQLSDPPPGATRLLHNVLRWWRRRRAVLQRR